MGISKEAATDLKHAANALAESEQQLRTAGNYTEGVAEAAAADYLEKRAEFDEKVAAVKSEHEAADSENTPEQKDRPDLAADPAAAGEKPQNTEDSPGSDRGTRSEEEAEQEGKDTGKSKSTAKETGAKAKS